MRSSRCCCSSSSGSQPHVHLCFSPSTASLMWSRLLTAQRGDQGLHTSCVCSFLVHKYLLQALTLVFDTLRFKEWLWDGSTFPVLLFFVQRVLFACVLLRVSSKAPQALVNRNMHRECHDPFSILLSLLYPPASSSTIRPESPVAQG